jgi:hypothetical protein
MGIALFMFNCGLGSGNLTQTPFLRTIPLPQGHSLT